MTWPVTAPPDMETDSSTRQLVSTYSLLRVPLR